jgi:hypothetical protein
MRRHSRYAVTQLERFTLSGDHDLLNDPKYGGLMPRTDISARIQANAAVSDRDYSVPMVAKGVKDVVRAGGHTALGAHAEQPGIGAHWNLWSFAEAFTPLESIRIASNGCTYFDGLDHELGSLESGKLADLVVHNGDPLEDIRTTLNIAYAMKSGRIYAFGTLNEIWPERSPYAPFTQAHWKLQGWQIRGEHKLTGQLVHRP